MWEFCIIFRRGVESTCILFAPLSGWNDVRLPTQNTVDTAAEALPSKNKPTLVFWEIIFLKKLISNLEGNVNIYIFK